MTNKKTEGATSAKVAPSTHGTSQVDNNTKSKKTSTGRGRTRNYATVVYPESAPADWLTVLDSLHVPAFVSPLHDADVNADNTPKKAHYHVLLMFAGVKTKEQAQAVIDAIGGVGCESVSTVRGYARYLVHADNPEKAQYSKSDVRAFGGADYDAVTHLPTDDVKITKEMMQFIRANQISSFAQFADICAIEHEDWFRALVTKSTYFIKEYIKSLVWEGKQ
ncbi:replication protein [Paratractidigestivibacter sp.]|uniref:replication protein n=1 Tax=Paratractidigestivibacter sp. TaxID=2847316 RepID=UPI003AB24617